MCLRALEAGEIPQALSAFNAPFRAVDPFGCPFERDRTPPDARCAS